METDSECEDAETVKLPPLADMLLIYSTVPGIILKISSQVHNILLRATYPWAPSYGGVNT